MDRLDKILDEVLVRVIMYLHPELLDDELSDVLNNESYVSEAKAEIRARFGAND